MLVDNHPFYLFTPILATLQFIVVTNVVMTTNLNLCFLVKLVPISLPI